MSESKHTPGPWVISDHKGFGVNIWNKAGDKCIAERVRLKDASIISAAPDMYQTLQHALIDMDAIDRITDLAGVHRFRLLRDEITAAIAKAEGKA